MQTNKQMYPTTRMIQNYKIVTLCGCTRFKEQFMEAQKQLTLEGCIVISVGLFGTLAMMMYGNPV